MLTIDTRHFGTLEYEPAAVLEFAEGLYAFEDQKEFLLIEQPTSAPIVFLQSLREPGLSFMALPVQVADPAYRLALPEEDSRALGFPDGYAPQLGRDIVGLVLLAVGPDQRATCNFLAPIVINHTRRCGRQVIQFDSGYSHQHVLSAVEAECC